MSVDSETRHCQAQAITMLAIATGALGFGLFGAKFRVSSELLPTMMLVAGGFALVSYVALAESVRGILLSDDVNGRHVARGPLRRMFLVVVYVSCVFVAGTFDSPPSP